MLLGGSTVDIGLRLYLKDEFSGPAAKIKQGLQSLREETRVYQDSLRSARNMYGSLFAAGAMAIRGLASAYQVGAKFDFEMRGVAAASGATADEFKRMTDEANRLGSTSLYTPKEFASTMHELAFAGLSAKETMASIVPVMHLAGGAMEDLKLSSEIATNAMYQFGYDKSKLSDWTYVSDVLAQGAVKSQITLRDLGESIKYAGATAMDLGQTLPDITAMVMTLGNAGIKGSMAGTAIENMFRYMALGLGQYAKTGRAAVWEKIGLDPKSMVTAQGNLKPMPIIFGNLYKALEKFGDVDRQNILYEIFNVRGKRGASKLLMDGMKEYSKHIKELENSRGVAEGLYGRMLDSPQGAIIKLKGTFEALMNTFTKTVAPLVTPLLQLLTLVLKGLTWITEHPILGWLVKIGTGFLLFKTLVWGAKAAIAGMGLAINFVNTSFATQAAAIKLASMELMQYIGLSNVAARMGATNWTGGGVMTAANGAMFMRNSATGGSRFVGAEMAGEMAGAGVILNASGQPIRSGVSAMGKLGRMSKLMGYGSMAMGKLGGMSKLLGYGGMAMGGYQLATGESTSDKLWGAGQMVGGGLMALWPEPIGKAIGAGLLVVSTVVPMLTNSTDRNTAAIKENTDATKANSDRLTLSWVANQGNAGESTYIRRLYQERGADYSPLDFMLEQKKRDYLSNPGAWGGKPFYDYSSPKGDLNIYIQGKLNKNIIKQEMNRNINTAITFE